MEQEFIVQNGLSILSAEKFKQRLAFIPCKRDLLQILDAMKVADMAIFLLSSNEQVDTFGENVMSAIKAQGVTNVICMVQHLEQHPLKKQKDIRGSLLYYMTHHFPEEEKLYSMGSDNECLNCIRQITSQLPKGVAWRERYPYLTAEHYEFIPSDDVIIFLIRNLVL
jgi:pre-rRNA-processing protein TSR1